MTTATTETLQVPRAALLDLLATLQAAGALLSEWPEPMPGTEFLRDEIYKAEDRFRVEFIGALGDAFDEYDARAQEIEADLLEAAWKSQAENEAARARFQLKSGRPAKLRVLAERIREVGMDDARYPTARELWTADDAR
jgi:hypothetical protein